MGTEEKILSESKASAFCSQEVVSKPQIRFKGKAQADRESAAYMGMWAFIGGLQHSHWALDGVLKLLLSAGCE